MSTPSPDEKSSSDAPQPSAATFMLGTIADTTWRMFIPSIGGTLMGVWADNSFGTKPWLMIAGIMIGVALAGLLVWRQIANQPTSNKRDKTAR